jgi:hypothetical protein
MARRNKTYKKHEYDIDLIQLERDIKEKVRQHSLQYDQFDAQNYMIPFNDYMMKYKAGNISQGSPYLVVPSNAIYYNEFLVYTLAHYDVPKIKLFLDHQRLQFKGSRSNKRATLIGIIEHLCYNRIKMLSLTETSHRLEKITEWIREFKLKKSPKNNIEPAVLIWNEDKMHELKKLSQELFMKEYTLANNSFQKVFKENEKCQWRKSPESLAYLLFRLYNHSFISTGGIRKDAVFKLADEQFYDISKKVEKKFNLRKAKYDISKRYLEKYKTVRRSIDFMLSETVGIPLPS